jgi:hypothetical protein
MKDAHTWMQTSSLKLWLCRSAVVSGLLCIALSSVLGLPNRAQALPDFSGTGRSGNRVGGASRGGCPNPEHPMMPLAPMSADYGGRTISDQPTVWVYVPYVLDEESPVTFAINDESGNGIYQTTFTTSVAPGVYGIQIPASVDLEPDQYYDWYVLVYCDDPFREDVPSFASGWIQRVAPSADMSLDLLETMSPEEQSQMFSEQLLWYDALTPLGESLQENSSRSTVRSMWNELLGLPSVQLDSLTQFPVISCCDVSD